MRLFQGLFGRKGVTSASNNHLSAIETPEKDEWELLPGYIPVESDDPTLVSLIATAIAAGDRPNSQFKVKKIWQRNPELLTVSLIATSIASIDKPDRQLVVKSVYRKKNEILGE